MDSFQELSQVWEKTTGTSLAQVKKEIVESQIPELKKFNTGLGTAALNVFDIEQNKFLYVDEQIEEVTGISRNAYLNRGPKYLLKKTYYPHIPQLIRTSLHQNRFFSKLPSSSIENFIVNREFAYYSNGQKRWVLHQTIKHLLNSTGHIFAVAVLQTRIERVKLDAKFRYYIFDRERNQICYPKPKLNKNDSPGLTKRELQIIDLLKQGYSSKQISEMLHLSFHTVRTHRRNIFNKLGCSNIVDLINKLSLY